MAIKIRIPTPLRRLCEGKEIVEVEGKNLREALENLEKKYPGFRERLFDTNGELRRFVNIFVNEEDIRFLNGLNTPLKDGDEVSIIPAIAGGKKKVLRLYLTYPSHLIKEPIIYQLGKKFKVVPNIRSASVKGDIGLVALELSGSEKELEKAIKWLEKIGIKVEPIEQDIVEG
jgi:molybdopterin synthase sulfur carrier subunit